MQLSIDWKKAGEEPADLVRQKNPPIEKTDDGPHYGGGKRDPQPTVDPTPEKSPQFHCNRMAHHFDLRKVAEPASLVAFIENLPWPSDSLR